MNIVYDLQAYSFGAHGGVVRFFDELLKDFAQRPGFSGLLHLSAPPQCLPPLSDNVRVCGPPRFPGILQRFRAAHWVYGRIDHAYWQSQKPQLLHPTFYPDQDRFLDLPWVVNVYDLIHETIKAADDMPDHTVFGRTKRRALHRAERILCISEATRRDLLAHYDVDADKTRVVHLGYDPAFTRMDEDETRTLTATVLAEPERPFLLYVGSRQRYKNFHRLIQAYGTWARRKEVGLVVVGAPKQMADDVLMDLTGTHEAEFIGHVSDRVLCALYNRACCLVYPSLCEGFGIPLLEALASWCPLCISDIPPFREVAGDSAVYFDPRSTESMHAALDASASARDDAVRLEANARHTERFSWSKCAEQVWGIYEELT